VTNVYFHTQKEDFSQEKFIIMVKWIPFFWFNPATF